MSASGASFEQMLLDALLAHQRYLVAAYAHELAEEIRQKRDAANVPNTSWAAQLIRGMGRAADFIDPEVTNNG